MHKVSIIILLLTIFFGFLKAQNTDSIIVLNDETEILNIGKQVYFLEDKEGKLTIEDIQKPEYQKQFKKSEQEILNFNTTNSRIWIKLIVNNQRNEKAYLEIAQAMAWYIDFYRPDSHEKLTLSTQTGLMRSVDTREVDSNFFTFELSNNKVSTYIFSIKSEYPLSIPLRIFSKNQILTTIIQAHLLVGTFIGIVIIMFFYNLFVYFSIADNAYLYYALYLLSMLFTTTFGADNYGYYFNPITYYSEYLIIFLYFNVLFVFLFLSHLFSLDYKSSMYKILIIWVLIYFLSAVYNFITGHYIIVFDVVQLVSLLVFLYILSNSIILFRKGSSSAKFIVFGYSFFLVGVIIYIFKNIGILPVTFFTTNSIIIGVSLEVFLFSLALSDRINVLRKEKQQAQLDALRKTLENERILKEQNEVLEEKVQEKTFALREQAEELKVTNEEMQVVNEELNSTVEELGLTLETLDTQKKIVESINRKITASINYAQTIQQAVLPDKLILESYLQDYFLLYRPKDIVSGDFYWVAPIPKGYVVAVADCTGHGVAGSFMSLVGINLLGKMEDELETLSPAEMIRRLNIGIDKALKQDERQSYNEGMDIGIVRVEKEGNNYTLTFAGAKRPLYYISKEERKLQEIAGDRFSVGIGTQREIFIQNHTLALKTGDSFYLLSDGLADQNNEKRKRLGENILKETLQNLFDQDSNTQLNHLNQLLDEHQGTAEQRDDITLLGIRL